MPIPCRPHPPLPYRTVWCGHISVPISPPHLQCKIGPFINQLNIVISWFSDEAREVHMDGLALCNLDALGGVMVVGVTLREVGRRQDAYLWHALPFVSDHP